MRTAVAEKILKQMGKSKDLIAFSEDRKGHDRRYAVDTTKIEEELGWKRTYIFDDGLRETIDWYLNHQNWIKNIQSNEYKNAFKIID